MKIEKASAPGFDEDIRRIVSSWGIIKLTHIQQVALSKGASNGKSLVVSSPTSSGKTLVAEIARRVSGTMTQLRFGLHYIRKQG